MWLSFQKPGHQSLVLALALILAHVSNPSFSVLPRFAIVSLQWPTVGAGG